MLWKFVSRQFERCTLRFVEKFGSLHWKKSKLGRDTHVDAPLRKILKHPTEVDTNPWWVVSVSFLPNSLYWNKSGVSFFFDLLYTFWGFLNPKMTFLVISPCMCLCIPVINITQKQIIVETPNLVFHICTIRKYYLKLFMNVRQLVYERILMHCDQWMDTLKKEDWK